VHLVDQQLGSPRDDLRLFLVDDELARRPALARGYDGMAVGRIAADPATLLDTGEATAVRSRVDLPALLGCDQDADTRDESVISRRVYAVQRDDPHRHVLRELEPLRLVAREAVERVGDDYLDFACECSGAELVKRGPRRERPRDAAVVVVVYQLPSLLLDVVGAAAQLLVGRGSVLL
jgi:hypothetical protein